MSCAKTNQRRFQLRIPQNKAIHSCLPARLATICPGGGLASFVLFACWPVLRCPKTSYKSNNPRKHESACQKVAKLPVHLAQVNQAPAGPHRWLPGVAAPQHPKRLFRPWQRLSGLGNRFQ